MKRRRFENKDAERIGEALGITWQEFSVDQFCMGLNVELEHGAHDAETNVTSDDEVATGKIAWAHLKEFPDYYTRLAAMEAQAKKERAAKAAR